MIFAALSGYYERIARESQEALPAPGYSVENVSFAVVIDANGNLVRIEDLRVGGGRKPKPRRMVVPQPPKKSVNIAPSFLWGSAAYVFGADTKVSKKKDRQVKCRDRHRELVEGATEGCNDMDAQAVLSFLTEWVPGASGELEMWEEIAQGNLVFRIDGKTGFVHENPAMKEAWEAYRGGRNEERTSGRCLVTGERTCIARLHPSIKGVRGAQSSGASIVSFNKDSFCSYGGDGKQGLNAPVGERVTFAYTTALNWLLKKQTVAVADTTVVFWAERKTPMESFFGFALNPAKDEAPTEEVRAYLQAARQGRSPHDPSDDTRFFVLGLAPNASRLSIRFWYDGTTGEIGERLGRHFADIAVEKQRKEKDPDFPPVWRLLLETAAQHESKNIPPLLGGAMLRSILNGGLYPNNLLSLLIMRMRAGDDVNYFKASLIKGFLVRNYNQSREDLMSLDAENKTPAYLLGRLFAILEKAQKDAVPGANATIKDRYYGSASATPRSVFPILLRTAQHHIAKAEYGRFTDAQIEKVVQDLSEFPAHLNLEQQGLFAMGYYHQRNANYNKKDAD